MILKRGSVLAVLLLTLIFVGQAQAQGQSQGVPAQIAALQAKVDQALAMVAKLQAALIAEAALREASDAALASSRSGGGVTMAQVQAAMGGQSSSWTTKLNEALAKLDAAISAEGAARSAAVSGLQGQIAGEAAARTALESTVAPLFTLVPLSKVVSVSSNAIDGLAGPHVIFTGVNLHIRNGSGESYYSPNGTGNLIVGYNEVFEGGPAERSGSHNVVVGGQHRYNFGTGLLGGFSNRLAGMGASVTAGSFNEAVDFSVVSGGSNNKAMGPFSTISGGDSNVTGILGTNAVVTAGSFNAANATMSSVTGGLENVAGAGHATVTGGSGNVNTAPYTVVP